MIDNDADEAVPAAAHVQDAGAGSRGRSHADRLREARRKRRADGGRTTDRLRLTIPPGEAVIVLRPVTTKSVMKSVQGKAGIGQHIALLLEHIERVDLLDPETGKIVPAATLTEHPDIPVGIDQRLQQLLELQGATPAHWLVDLYEGQDWPIVKHSMRLDAWSSGEDLDTDSVGDIEDLMDPQHAATRS